MAEDGPTKDRGPTSQGKDKLTAAKSSSCSKGEVGGLNISTPEEVMRRKLEGKRAGRWSPEEKLLFLHGLKIFGRGRWKRIQTFLPTRSLVQIKSHAQKVVKRLDAGENIFAPLTDKASFLEMLLAKRSSEKGGATVKAKIPRARARPVPKPKLKPRPVPFEDPSQENAIEFLVGQGNRRENANGSPFYRTKFGSGNVSFSFRPPAPQASKLEDDETSSSPSLASEVPAVAPSDCVTPDRPEPTVIKSTAVIAAAALCQLSTVGRDKKSSGEQGVNVVSP